MEGSSHWPLHSGVENPRTPSPSGGMPVCQSCLLPPSVDVGFPEKRRDSLVGVSHTSERVGVLGGRGVVDSE